MMFHSAVTVLIGLHCVTGALIPRQTLEESIPAKVEVLTAKYLKDLGAQRVKITYGPLAVPSANDKDTGGMITYRDYNLTVPCYNCLITGLDTDLTWEDGTTANANKGIWLHHTGLMNLNRTDAACPEWPERIGVNGNERSSFDFTLKGTRKAGYYISATDQIFKAIDIMNLAPKEATVYLTTEWEYIPLPSPQQPSPSNLEIIIPVWLDARGNCFEIPLEETILPSPTSPVFNSSLKSPGFTIPFNDSDLFLLVSHIHDGNTAQEIFMDGKLICSSVPTYGETEAFVTHEGMFGHGHEDAEDEKEEEEHHHGPHKRRGGSGDHDHETSGHIYHVSSITQCTNIGKVPKGAQFTLTSYYNMTEHKAMTGHDGEEEEIMAIEFLHFARPMEAAIRDILAQGKPNLQSFLDRVRSLDD